MGNPSASGPAGPAGPFDVEGAPVLVVGRHRVAPAARAGFLADAERALDALAGQSGFLRGSVGQSTDDVDLLLIRTEWAGVGAYRRALSSYAVKVDAVPVLSTAVDEPSSFESVLSWENGEKSTTRAGLALES